MTWDDDQAPEPVFDEFDDRWTALRQLLVFARTAIRRVLPLLAVPSPLLRFFVCLLLRCALMASRQSHRRFGADLWRRPRLRVAVLWRTPTRRGPFSLPPAPRRRTFLLLRALASRSTQALMGATAYLCACVCKQAQQEYPFDNMRLSLGGQQPICSALSGFLLFLYVFCLNCLLTCMCCLPAECALFSVHRPQRRSGAQGVNCHTPTSFVVHRRFSLAL
jgi:hypothetical protein